MLKPFTRLANAGNHPGSGLGLTVVAEGVEDTECLEFLKSVGCDMAQGYLISKPVPAADISAMTGTQRAAA